jgi:hypothetical protein
MSPEDMPARQPHFEAAPAPSAEMRDMAPTPEPSREAAPDATNPRRGSTVREPASFTRPPADAPPPSPVLSSSGEEPAAPKRGWWGRRILGDKS